MNLNSGCPQISFKNLAEGLKIEINKQNQGQIVFEVNYI